MWNHSTNVAVSIRSWGWGLLILGVIVVLAGFGVMTGNVLARIVGVCVAGLSLIGNFLTVPIHPLWALALLVVDALVIYALIAHGGEMREVD